MSYELLWLKYFALTVAIELAVAVPLLRGTEPSRARRVAAVVLCNLASHPLVWFFFPRLLPSRATFIPVAEGWAIGSEALIYLLVFPGMPRARALGVSGVANAASFLVGVLLQRLAIG
ncbi:MAG: hypothetical protein ACRELB_26820 [Polyangiaceae bacterium]